MTKEPQFPITARWVSTGEVESFANIAEIEQAIEHVDTKDGEVEVLDSGGRRIRLRIFLLRTEVFELIADDELVVRVKSPPASE